MKKNLPTYEFVIDDTEASGVKAISIVSDPAFQSKLIAFSAIKSQFIAVPDIKGKKRKVAGLALIPNTPVFRIDEYTGQEYMGYFSAETIEKIVEKFHTEMNNNKVNLNHNDNQFVDAVLIEDYIVDSQARVDDLKSKGIEHENILGSWYTCYKIKSDEIFEAILRNQSEGNGTGFSVECYLDRIMVQMNKNNYREKMKKNNKSLLNKIVDLFKSEIFERALVPELGFEIEWNEVGSPVNKVIVDQNGNETFEPIGPGEFITEMGIVVVDDASNLLEVRELPAQPEAPVAAAEIAPTDEVSGNTETSNMEAEDSIKLEDEDLKKYPWDQCISDQLAAGYSQEVADKICGWIKANNSSQEMVTDEVLKTILSEDEYLACKKKDEMADPMMPEEEIPSEAPEVSPDVKSKTIGDIVGVNDGEYWVKVVVEGGVITEAEVSSETNLLKTTLEEVKKENSELKDKLKEPIGEPVLAPIPEKKDWNKMSTYEKALSLHKK